MVSGWSVVFKLFIYCPLHARGSIYPLTHWYIEINLVSISSSPLIHTQLRITIRFCLLISPDLIRLDININKYIRYSEKRKLNRLMNPNNNNIINIFVIQHGKQLGQSVGITVHSKPNPNHIGTLIPMCLGSVDRSIDQWRNHSFLATSRSRWLLRGGRRWFGQKQTETKTRIWCQIGKLRRWIIQKLKLLLNSHTQRSVDKVLY